VIDTIADDLTDEEVQRAQNKLAVDLTLQHERPAGRMMGLGGSWICTGEYRSLDDELSRLMAVDVNAVKTIAKQYPATHRAVVRCAPPVA